jgi:hypothetical protein
LPWESAAAQRRRQITIVSLLGGFALLSAATIFWFFVQSIANKKTIIAQPKAVQLEQRPPVEPFAVEPSADREPSDPPATTGPAGALTVEMTEPRIENQVDQGVVSATQGDSNLGVQPSVNNVEADSIPVSSANGSPQREVLDLPAELRQFVPLLSDARPIRQPEMLLETPPTADEIRLRLNLPVPSDQRLHPDPAPKIDVQPRLQRKLEGFLVHGDSLVDFCGRVSQMTGVPIWFDLAMIDSAGIDLSKPLSIKAGRETIGELLNRVVRDSGCMVVEEPEGMLKIRVSDEKLMERLLPALKTDDFETTDEDLREVVKRLVPVMEKEEQSVRIIIDGASRQARGEGAASVGQFWLAALSIEALRESRGQSPRLTRAMTQRWLVMDRMEPQPTIAAVPTRLEIDQALTVGEWIHLLAKESNASAFIQWDGVWKHGLTPTMTRLPYLQGKTNQEVLQQLLGDYDLRAYQDGPDAWWIGTPDGFQQRLCVASVVIPEPLRTRGKELIEALAKSLGVTPNEVPAYVDSKSGRLLLQMRRQMVGQVQANMPR